MSSRLEQVAIAVVTAGAISFGSVTFYAGQRDKQVETNAADIASIKPQVARIPVIETNLTSMNRRLDTYEKLVIDGQEEQRRIATSILSEIKAMRIDTAINTTEIGAIKTDINEIKQSINN